MKNYVLHIRARYWAVFFIVVSTILCLLIIIKSITYFRTDADRSNILSVSKGEQSWYQPEQIWQKKTFVDSLLFSELKRDYTRFWLEKYKSEKFQNPEFVSYFIDQKNVKSLEPYFQDSVSVTHFFQENYLVSHQPTLKFFSKDGHFAIIEDSAMIFIEKSYQNHQLIQKKWVKKKVNSNWLLSSGIWKLRHISIEDSEPLESKKNGRVNPLQNYTIKGTNYYPQNQAWNKMWKNYNPQIIESDLKNIRDAGLNTVRVFIPYEEWGKENVKDSILVHFEYFLAAAKRHQLMVIPTLFDFFGNYEIESYSQVDQHLRKILTRIGNHPQILAWDIKNEPDLDFQYHGDKTVIDWLEFVIKRARHYAPEQSFTIGWSNSEDAAILGEEMDFISFHYYKKPAKFIKDYQHLKERFPNKNIVMTEFGRSSFNAFWYPFSKNDHAQLDYYLEMFQNLKKVNNPHFMHWTLYDFPTVPNKVVGKLPWRKKIQQHYGFIDQNGNPKISYKVIDGDISETKKPYLFQLANSFQIAFILFILLFIVGMILFVKKTALGKRYSRIFKIKII